MSDSPYIYEVTAENFEQIVLNGSMQTPVLVDLWADWCQPCKMLMPVLAKLAEEYAGRFILAKVDTEQEQALAAQFQVRSIPSVKLVIGGQVVDGFDGALPESGVREFLDRHLPRESDDAVGAAEQRLAAGDAAGALELLAPAQAADPANHRILLVMAQAHLVLGQNDQAQAALDALPLDQQDKQDAVLLRGQLFFAREALELPEIDDLQRRLQADPTDSQAHYQLAVSLVMQMRLEDALDQFLKLMMRDRDYGEDAARQALLRLFDMLGAEHPLVAPARRRMFNLLH